jgi:hypothetical protein
MIIVKINKLLQTKLKALICCLILMFAAKANFALAKIDSSKVALDSVPYFFKDDFSHKFLFFSSNSKFVLDNF